VSKRLGTAGVQDQNMWLN